MSWHIQAGYRIKLKDYILIYLYNSTFSIFSIPQVIYSSQDLAKACTVICPNWWLQERASRAVWHRWTSMVACRISSAMPCFAVGRLNVDAKVLHSSNSCLIESTTQTSTPIPAVLSFCQMQVVVAQACIHSEGISSY